jgi:hypothetical protein
MATADYGIEGQELFWEIFRFNLALKFSMDSGDFWIFGRKLDGIAAVEISFG